MAIMIVEAEPAAHRAEILATWRDSFPAHPERRFDWMYRENPAGPACCWLARTEENGSVVGACAVFPREFLVGGQRTLAGIAGDFSVSPRHRGFGPALALQRAAVSGAQAAGMTLLYGLPTAQAAPVQERAGYVRIGDVAEMTRLLKSKAKLQQYTRSPGLAGLLARPVDAAGRLLSVARTPKRSTGLVGRQPAHFDHHFDQLWRAASQQFPLIGDRSAAYLEWRFRRSPHSSHRIFSLAEVGSGELVGYVVYHLAGERVNVDDMLSRDAGPLLDALIGEFVRAQYRQGREAITVFYFGSKVLAQRLRRHGFSARGVTAPVLIHVEPSSPLSTLARDPENWWLFPADNDI